jgi:MFS transporter, DHA2 family, multidrug resistance protein
VVSPDFTMRLMHDLTHAYTLVIAVAVVIVALTLVPVAFLPNKPPAKGQPPVPTY